MTKANRFRLALNNGTLRRNDEHDKSKGANYQTHLHHKNRITVRWFGEAFRTYEKLSLPLSC